MKHVQKNPVNPLIGLIMVLAMAFIFSCSGDSNESPDQPVSSSSGGGGSSGLEVSSSSGGGGDPSSSSLGDPSSSSILSSSSVHVHVWGEWETTTPATCAAAGEKTRTCTDDGTVEEEVIPKISYNVATQFCQSGTNAVKPFCNGQTYGSTEQCQNDIVVTDQCGTSWYHSSTHFCKNNLTLVEYGSVQDESDISYKTIVIGTQTWMAENLNYEVEGSKCYGDNTGGDSRNRCGTYGRLYNWATAMALDASCNSTSCSSSIDPKHRGICPEGWHIPSQAEWNILSSFIGGSSTEGKHLKFTSGWNSNGNGQDTYGFAALPGGYGYSGGHFLNVGDGGYWWSSYEINSSLAYDRSMYYDYEDADWGINDKSNLYSVRCAQD